jgi:hypothetical protein
MKNCNRISHTCGQRTYLVCSEYEGTVNSDSSLVEESCLNGQEVVQDIYNQLENLDLSALGELCLTYVQENNKNIVKNVLLKFEEEICNLKEELETVKNRQICDIPITECLPNGFDCIIGDCDNSIVTLKDWMLAMQTRICETP